MRKKKRDNPLFITILFFILVFLSVIITVEFVTSSSKDRSFDTVFFKAGSIEDTDDASLLVPHLQFAAPHIEATCLIKVRKAYPDYVGLYPDPRSTIIEKISFKVFILHSKGASNFKNSVYICRGDITENVIKVRRIYEIKHDAG